MASERKYAGGSVPAARNLRDSKYSVARRPLLAQVREASLYRVTLWAILLFGIAFRLEQYLYNRSLWMDEAFLALNIIDRPFADLFGQLSFNQAAPPGFLFVERLNVEVFGRSEYALRLFPLVCGIASIFLFLRVAQDILDRRAVLVSLFLFTIADGLVYYSSEVKQYSVDVAAILLFYLAGLELRSRPLTPRPLILWGLVGSFVVWFSHAAAFAAAGVIIAIVVPELLRRSWKRARALAAVAVVWAAPLGAALWYAESRVSHLLTTYKADREPGVTGSEALFPTDLGWFREPAGAIAYLLGIPASGTLHRVNYAVALVGLVGAVALARRALGKAALIAMPVPLTLAAAALELYPIVSRTILFWLPLAILVIGQGVVAAGSIVRRRRTLVTVLVALIVCTAPAATAAKYLATPREREDIKPVVSHLAAQAREGDALHVFYRAQYAFRYYLECDCLDGFGKERLPWIVKLPPRAGPSQYAPAVLSDPPSLVVGAPRPSLREYVEQVAVLGGRRRVWVLVTRASPDERALLEYLSCVGDLRNTFGRTTAALYLYDLSDWRSVDASGVCG